MIKKAPAKKLAKRSRPKRPKAGVKLTIEKNPKLAKRLKQLGLDASALDVAALKIFLELRAIFGVTAEVGRLINASVEAYTAAAFVSDDPKGHLEERVCR